MDLQAKAAENIGLVEHAVRSKRFCTSVAGRLYYAVFQKIKHYLKAQGFDYKAFLVKIGRADDYEYSHKTVKRALVEQLSMKGIKLPDLNAIQTVDQLYRVRLQADYYEEEYCDEDLQRHLETAKSILLIISRY